MADLKDFYPGATQTSPNGSGAPANPGAVSSGGAAMGGGTVGSHMQQPVFWTLAIVAIGFFLLHKT